MNIQESFIEEIKYLIHQVRIRELSQKELELCMNSLYRIMLAANLNIKIINDVLSKSIPINQRRNQHNKA